ncbi:MAG: hypothetical protein IJK01_07055 [Clostridia bacterium]|nr:hypothetical protein [Clostridia bacterium]
MVWFLLGLFVGAFFGFITCALAIAASKAEQEADRDLEKITKKEDTYNDWE